MEKKGYSFPCPKQPTAAATFRHQNYNDGKERFFFFEEPLVATSHQVSSASDQENCHSTTGVIFGLVIWAIRGGLFFLSKPKTLSLPPSLKKNKKRKQNQIKRNLRPKKIPLKMNLETQEISLHTQTRTQTQPQQKIMTGNY